MSIEVHEKKIKKVMMALDRSSESISLQNEFDLIFGSNEQKLWGHIYFPID